MNRIAFVVAAVLWTATACGLAGPDADHVITATKIDGCKKSGEEPEWPGDKLIEKLSAEREALGISENDAASMRDRIVEMSEADARAALWTLCMVEIGASCPDPDQLGHVQSCRVDLPGGFGTEVLNPFV